MAADAYASSLNVACAASIMFHEAVSQRAKPSPPSNLKKQNNAEQTPQHGVKLRVNTFSPPL
ncbi:MAG: hypothetical protein ACOX63_02520 [Christensenellales bacterium]|jgi:hypothetical protein